MITPVASVHPTHVEQVQHPSAPKSVPAAQTSKSGALSHDHVTLKSAGEPDEHSTYE
ncbi:MAG TPA: hypothetical protein VKQ11_22770 [Candidatus Sulfotelmatobacter sp.]|nr:hypothetical protein [Candidatus Sulfotelmatobacter sp.]